MGTTEEIKNAVQRNKKLLTIKPSKGQYTTTTHVRLTDGTTCEIEHGPWTFKADIGKTEGGNDAGPGPGILERAALGSCLAIGYAQQAALMDVPIESLEVDVEAEVDARGTYGIGDVTPEYQALRYRVNIVSPAPEEKIREVIDQADAHSPGLNNLAKPLDIKREITINNKEGELS